jgi:hypothetical protein
MVTIAFEDSSPQQQCQEDMPNIPVDETQKSEHENYSMQPDAAASPHLETDSSVPTLLSEQDHVVFGRMNHELTDFLAGRIEETIQRTVMGGLPLLEDGPAKTQLQDTLVYKFVRNIDVLEAYCAQNVTTLRKYPPATRKRIVQVLRNGERVLDSLPTSPFIDSNNSILETSIPTKDMLPSKSESKSLQDDLVNLQERLKAARSVRNDLLVQQKSLQRAQSITSRFMETLEKHRPMVDTDASSSMVMQQVNAVVTDGNSVHQLTEEAQTILDKLNRQKRPPASKADEEEYDPFFSETVVKQPRLSLEEAYHQDRKHLGLLRDTTNGQGNEDTEDISPVAKLTFIKNLLKRKPLTENCQ